ncbi:MAG: sugar ABC transporter permease [Clostridiales bacterium]|nr:sugar ABC transporter permease [Clostridiales bacterium]
MDVKANKDLTVISMKKRQRKSTWKLFKNDIALYIMLLVPVTVAVIFRYIPIGALIMSFKDYNFVQGILGSPWVGFKWFEKFLSSAKFATIFLNTLKISVYSLVFSFPCPIILALSLNEVTNDKFKRAVQTASYLPYFVSTVVVISMMNQILSPTTGIVNNVIVAMGGTAINFQADPKAFLPMYIISGIWSGIGYSSILYLSALTGISQELYEAAVVDGAGRWRKMFHITIPGILPTIVILLLMNLGTLLNVGFEKAYLMQNDLNISASEIIGTYVYKQGLVKLDYSYSAAVGMFQSVINLVLITVVNTISKKVADISLW